MLTDFTPSPMRPEETPEAYQARLAHERQALTDRIAHERRAGEDAQAKRLREIEEADQRKGQAVDDAQEAKLRADLLRQWQVAGGKAGEDFERNYPRLREEEIARRVKAARRSAYSTVAGIIRGF